MKSCLVIIIIVGAIVGFGILKGPELMDAAADAAKETIKDAQEGMTQFNEMNHAFIQSQIDTQKEYNADYLSDGFKEKTSMADWERALSKFRGSMGMFTGCKIAEQSVQLKSFSSEFSISTGSVGENGNIVLGSDSKGPNGGDRAVVTIDATYENGTTKETYYWGKQGDDTFKLWRIEITEITLKK